ncbi:DUF3570 domain-containing protein [bacterium SCSIO 12696]|nr:DUF3570 domain-containing protein [bacterium SCSIO 12696]
MYSSRAKAREVQKVVREAAVGVTDFWSRNARLTTRSALGTLFFALFSLSATAATLPDDRLDILYHGYKGGGATIDGPSVLVRKTFADKVSVRANYYTDFVSSASIDVIATASAYEEERNEFSVGMDYLHNKTTMSLNVTSSSENDYEAQTVGFSISQDFFGDLSTLALSYAVGSDTVRRRDDDVFEDEIDRQQFSLTFTQILTQKLVASLAVESIVDEGFLNNPYRQYRFVDASEPLGFGYALELYPRTRNSDAVALRSLYYLPWHASLKGEYRRFADSWGIEADSVEFGYTHPWKHGLTFEAKLRHYKQDDADFYSDIFAFEGAQNFLARDKELSTFTSNTIGIGVSYEIPNKLWGLAKKSTVNLFWDRIAFDYDNFRDVTVHNTNPGAFAVGSEPLYSFDADVIRLFLSVWY